MTELGNILKQRRVMIPLTLRQLSAASGVSASYLGRIERGERYPSALILKRLAEPLGFSEVELLKLAGYLSKDDSDERIARFKEEIKEELARAFASISQKVDRL